MHRSTPRPSRRSEAASNVGRADFDGPIGMGAPSRVASLPRERSIEAPFEIKFFNKFSN